MALMVVFLSPYEAMVGGRAYVAMVRGRAQVVMLLCV